MSKPVRTRFSVFSTALALTSMGGLISPVFAANPAGAIDLSPTPVDISIAVAPNVALTFDDSGSMSFAYMPDTQSACGNQFTDSSFNKIYFDPNIIYSAPLTNLDGTPRNATYNKAWTNGFDPGSATINLSNNYKPTQVYDQDGQGNHTQCSQTGSGNQAYWTEGSTKKYPTTAQQQNFANWYSYYRTRNLMAKSAIRRSFSKMSEDVRVVWQTIWPQGKYKNGSNNYTNNWGAELNTIDALRGQRKVDFFDWLGKIRSGSGTPDREATVRVGEFFAKKDTSLTNTNPYWNGKALADGGTSLSCRKNFHVLVTDGYWNEGSTLGTPANRPANYVGHGYNYSDSGAKLYKNVTSDDGKSLANIAFHYWATDLRPDIADNVKPNGKAADYKGGFYNPNFDPATWQHVSQYIVTLGVNGQRTPTTDVNAGDLKKLIDGTIAWPSPQANQSSAIDDMWHAAINSRGGYFSANDPQALVDSLTAILNNVTQGNNSAVSGSLNTAVLTDGALSYSTGYDSTDWSGSVAASAVDPTDGTADSILWDAKNKLPAASGRKIFTGALNSTTHVVSGVDFVWANLPVAQQNWLKTTPYTATVESNAALAQKRLSWLRGSQADEGTASGDLRTRTNLLGAVINSQAKYVAYPTDGYRNAFPKNADGSVAAENAAALEANGGHSYEQFVSDHLDRTPTVYVGANDGMLHAIDASVDAVTGVPTSTAGTEKWAYVPYSVYPNLSKLSSQDFSSRFVPTVDNSPVTRDVFFGGAWHSILVAGLRYGGRGVYALDITSTDTGDITAAKKVLWEFSADASGADVTDLDKGNNPANLGYTYGQPNVARLSSGKWVVLVPSGYFPTCDKQFSPQPCVDAAAASNTRSSLFVLDAGTGALIKEIRTPAGVISHGLTSPVVGDYNDDQVDDVAYAGDLDGNMWRFDLGNGSVSATDSSAGVLQLFKPDVAGAQPITVMPRLFPDPATNNLIVVFGTGKFLTAADNVTDTSTVTQSVYGIRDKADASGAHNTTVVRGNLTAQTLVETQVVDPDTKLVNYVRGLSNVAVPVAQGGWYFDLNVKDADGKLSARGEKVVVTPAALFDTNRAIISTLIPRGDDACDPRRDGALLVINAATGGSGDGLSYPSLGSSSWYGTAGANTKVAGARVKNPPTGGGLPIAAKVGGGSLLIPGVELGDGGTFKIDDAIWRRRSWRVLSND